MQNVSVRYSTRACTMMMTGRAQGACNFSFGSSIGCRMASLAGSAMWKGLCCWQSSQMYNYCFYIIKTILIQVPNQYIQYCMATLYGSTVEKALQCLEVIRIARERLFLQWVWPCGLQLCTPLFEVKDSYRHVSRSRTLITHNFSRPGHFSSNRDSFRLCQCFDNPDFL